VANTREIRKRRHPPVVRPRDLVGALLGTPTAMAWAGLTAAGLDHRLVVETLQVVMTPGGVRTGWWE